MSQLLALSGRAIREVWRTPEQLVPTVFIPLFFLVVNVGQAGRIIPAGGTPFLEGQNYAAFQVPSAILLASSFEAQPCTSSRTSRGGTSTSSAPRRYRGPPSCSAA